LGCTPKTSFAFEEEKGHKKTAKSFAAVAKTNDDREADFC